MLTSRPVPVAAIAVLILGASLSKVVEGVRTDAKKAAVADSPRTLAVARSPERGVFVVQRSETLRPATSSSHRVDAPPPRLDFPIVPLDPRAGFVVDADTLEWLPRGLGLQAGDTLLGINDEPVVSTGQLLEAVRGASEGSSVQLRVRRASTGEVLSYWASP
jgi:S1-C subfamily serine protease